MLISDLIASKWDRQKVWIISMPRRYVQKKLDSNRLVGWFVFDFSKLVTYGIWTKIYDFHVSLHPQPDIQIYLEKHSVKRKASFLFKIVTFSLTNGVIWFKGLKNYKIGSLLKKCFRIFNIYPKWIINRTFLIENK